MDTYDWSEIGARGETVVDLGGCHGGVSLALAKTTSKLHCIVQDLPETVPEGENAHLSGA